MNAPTPTTSPVSGSRYEIDRLVLNDRRLFGWGWAADDSQAVRSVHLRVEGAGWTRRIAAGAGLSRRDVREAFPHLVNADTSGFVVTGYIPERGSGKVWLEVEPADGTTLAPFPSVCLAFDHNMGGGANRYCRGIVAERIAAGQAGSSAPTICPCSSTACTCSSRAWSRRLSGCRRSSCSRGSSSGCRASSSS
jgi:hypothetical protein